MEVYLVGGAVRDELLGLPIKERDWVVVGSSPKEMVRLGYKPVGKDFPVFLHPKTNEEYALARTERKSGQGYYGFEIFASPDVSLQEDLLRRDLTINAMAKGQTGEIIDPYGGQQDLEKKLLRHVSDAFSEDPLRVLRVARFAAKLKSQDFKIADETLTLMLNIVKSGELKTLASERIWQETKIALSTDHPGCFFSILHNINALEQTHTGINNAFSIAKKNGLQALTLLCKQEKDPCARFAALVGGLYYKNQESGEKGIAELTTQLPLPNDCKDLVRHTIKLQHQCHNVFDLDQEQLLGLLHKLDARRKPERFKTLLKIFSAVYQTVNSQHDYPQADLLARASTKIENVNMGKWVKEGLTNQELADKLRYAQLEILNQMINQRG